MALISPLDRGDSLALIIHTCKVFGALSSTKYCALSLLADCFLPRLHRSEDSDRNLLLLFIRKRSLQWVALVFLWTASKIHETKPFTVFKLKDIANKVISDYHFTKRDFPETEILLMKALNFNLATTLVPSLATDFLAQLRDTAKVGKLVSFETIFDIVDLLYESSTLNFVKIPADLGAASVLAAAYVLSVPQEKCNFPLLAWLTTITKVDKAKLKEATQAVLMEALKSAT